MPKSWLPPLLALAACAQPPPLDGEGQDQALVPAAPTLHRLTREQYQRSVRLLLGGAPDGAGWLMVPADLEEDTPLHGYRSVGAAALTISPRAAEQYEAAALQLARQAFADVGRRQAVLGCAPAAPDDACARRFLATFGRRAFRRPLTEEELEQLAGLGRRVAGILRSPLAGLEYAVAAVLQSPHFLFRVERGEPDPDRPDQPGRLRYTGYEMAARLSFFLWNSGPDDELLEAAERGELLRAEGVRAQAERLLQAPAAREALGGFFAELLTLDRLDTVSKDRTLYPQFSPQLAQAMRAEVVRAVDDLVFGRGGDYRDLLDLGSTFVNGDLARLYGLPGVQGAEFRRMELPAGPRGGLLGTAALLTLNAHAAVTSPTLRGKFIRQQLLCQDIPPPPPGVVTSLAPPMGGRPMTLRERLEQHRKDPACRSCHERMDPLGLGLEGFDAIGAARDKDNGLPVDASGDLDGVPFEGPRALGRLLRDHAALGLCLVRQLYRHATGHLESRGEEPAVQALWRRFTAGHRVRELVLDLVVSDGFRKASAEEASAMEGGDHA